MPKSSFLVFFSYDLNQVASSCWEREQAVILLKSFYIIDRFQHYRNCTKIKKRLVKSLWSEWAQKWDYCDYFIFEWFFFIYLGTKYSNLTYKKNKSYYMNFKLIKWVIKAYSSYFYKYEVWLGFFISSVLIFWIWPERLLLFFFYYHCASEAYKKITPIISLCWETFLNIGF